MPSVDQRIVEMQFDNAQFEKEVKTSLNTLDSLKDKLNFASITAGLGDFQAVAKRFSLFNITDTLRNISDGFANMGIIGITVLQNLTNEAVNAGKKMVSALSVEPVLAGWNKYEKKTIAVQTLLNSTGKSAEEIYAQLDKLSFFTDQTSYEFTTMVESIGKFTSNGVALEPAVTAMQGIATWAALAGQNAQVASGVMFQLSQAIGSGRVIANDWMSIEKANMATKEFKQTVIDTAKELKILNKNGKTKKGTLVTTENFRSTLSEGWFNKAVLMKSLEKYGEFADQVYKLVKETGMSAADATAQLSHEIQLVGEKGWKAARLARTFTDAMNATKDAVSSGWMKSFEILFGQFDDAVLLWTGLSEVLWEVFASGAEARNELLQGWKDLGGRTVLLDALADAYNGIVQTFKTVGEAFSSIFPKTTKEQLLGITNAFHKLANWFKMGAKDLGNLSKVSKGLFAILDIVVMAFRAVGKAVGKLLSLVSPLASSILELLVPIADWAMELRNFVKESDIFNKAIEDIAGVFGVVAKEIKGFGETMYAVFQSFGGIDLSGFEAVANKIKEKMAPMTSFGDILRNVFNKLLEVIKVLMPYLRNVWDSIVTLFNKVGKSVKDGLKNIGFDNINDVLNTGILAVLAVWIGKFVKNLYKLVEDADTIAGSLTKVFNSIGNSLKSWQQNLKAKTIMTIATAIAILTVAIIAMSMIDPAKLTKALVAIGLLFGGLVLAMKEFDKLKPSDFKEAGTIFVTIASLLGIATAILILSSALKKIADLPTDSMTKGIATIGILLWEIKFFMKNIDPKQVALQGQSILWLAGGMLVLALAVQLMGKMDPIQMFNGLFGILFALTSIMTFYQNLPSDKKVAAASASIVLIAYGMTLMAAAIALIGMIDPTKAGQGILGIGALLGMISMFFNYLPDTKAMIKGSLALVVVAGALTILAGVLFLIGSMSIDTIIKGVIGISYSLFAIAFVLNVMKSAVGGAFALLIVSAALLVLAGVLRILSFLTLDQLGMGLLAIFSVLSLIGIMSIGLAFLSPFLMLLAAALLLLGIAALSAGAGVLLFSMSLQSFMLFGVLGTAALAASVTALLLLIPLFLAKVGEGLIEFAKVIAAGAPEIANAVVSVFTAILDAITKTTPIVALRVAQMLLAILTVMLEYVPQFVDKGMKLIAGILTGIADNLQSVVEAAADVVLAFMAGITAKLPELIDSAIKFVLAWINGIADGIRTNKKEIKEAAFNLVRSLLEFVIEFLGLTEIAENAGKVFDAIVKGFGSALETVGAWGGALWQLGKDIVGGIMKGLLDMGTSFIDTGKEVVGGFIDGVKKFLGIKSPSKVGVTIGEFFSQGFINGVTNLTGDIGDSATTVGKTAVDAMRTAIAQVSSVIDGTDSNFNPVISPIIDMTNVDAGINSINGKFAENRKLSVSGVRANAMSVSAQVNSAGQISVTQPGEEQAVSKTSTYVFNQNNYSPKELNRMDIYRQTKNQFAMMKGLVNDV